MRRRLLLLLNLWIPLFLSGLPFCGLWLWNYQQQDRLKALKETWTEVALNRLDNFRGGATLESQVSRFGIEMKKLTQESLKRLPEDQPGLSSGILTKAFYKVFPASHRPPGTKIYGFSADSRKRATLLRGNGLTESKGKLIIDALEQCLNIGALSTEQKNRLNKRCSGLFGDFITSDMVGIHRLGKLTPGTFEGREVEFYWNTITFNARPAGGFLIIFPKTFSRSARPLEFAFRKFATGRNRSIVPILVPCRLSTPPKYYVRPGFSGISC